MVDRVHPETPSLSRGQDAQFLSDQLRIRAHRSGRQRAGGERGRSDGPPPYPTPAGWRHDIPDRPELRRLSAGAPRPDLPSGQLVDTAVARSRP